MRETGKIWTSPPEAPGAAETRDKLGGGIRVCKEKISSGIRVQKGHKGSRVEAPRGERRAKTAHQRKPTSQHIEKLAERRLEGMGQNVSSVLELA